MEDTRYITIVNTLNQMTKEKTITWEPAKAPALYSQGQNFVINDYYTTTLSDGQKWGIGDFRYQHLDMETENYQWRSVIRLFIYNNRDEVWDFPDIPGTFYIIDEIRYQRLDVDGNIDSFIKNYGS